MDATEAGPIYRHVGTGMGALMWFWIEWRAYHDLGTMLVRDPPIVFAAVRDAARHPPAVAPAGVPFCESLAAHRSFTLHL